MAIVTDLITRFRFEGSTQELNNYNDKLGDSIKLLAGMTAALGAVGAGMMAWTSSVLANEQPLIDLADQTGVAVEKIQELQFIASKSNSSAEALSASLLELNKRIGEASEGGIEEFRKLGVAIRDANGDMRSADDVLMQIGERFRELDLSTAQQQHFADRFGLDVSLLTMLRRTNTEMSDMAQQARDLGILNEEQVASAAEYNDALTTLKFGLGGLKRLIAVGLAPELTRLAESFAALIVENKEWIVAGIQKTAETLGAFFRMIKRTWPVWGGIAAGFALAKIAAIGFTGALTALGRIPIVAGIFLLLGAIEDLWVGFNGGKSVIMESTKGLRLWVTDAIERSINKLNKLIATLKEVYFFMEWVNSFGQDTGVSQVNQKEAAENAWNARRLGEINEAFRGGKISREQQIALVESGLGVDYLLGGLENYGLDDGLTSREYTEALKKAREGLKSGEYRQLNAQDLITNDMGANRTTTINQNVKMEIKTNDPVKAGETATDKLQTQLRDAEYQGTRTGDR